MVALPHRDHRRRASHLYGLIIGGSVLAAIDDDMPVIGVAALLTGTLLVYWAAETYAQWMASRMVLRRDLDPRERREIFGDGLPLVTACAVPISVLLFEALFGVPTAVAVTVAMAINVALLVALGWRMSTISGLRGGMRVLGTVLSGLLGAAMIALKLTLHH